MNHTDYQSIWVFISKKKLFPPLMHFEQQQIEVATIEINTQHYMAQTYGEGEY